jgi:hypothetical protein
MEWNEEQGKKLLNKLKQDPNFELMQEYGRLLMKHINSFTPEERKRYNELGELLKNKS